jgi:hypothetical protein
MQSKINKWINKGMILIKINKWINKGMILIKYFKK